MSAYSGAFGVNGGYNQSGGGYYIALENLNAKAQTLTPGSGSGGAATVGTFAAFSWGTTAYPSSLVASNKVIKDMGKTVVSAARTFRKFQAVDVQTLSTSGVVGAAGSSTNPGYVTFYLELNKDGVAPAGAAIARYA
jgi:hypothetical protein